MIAPTKIPTPAAAGTPIEAAAPTGPEIKPPVARTPDTPQHLPGSTAETSQLKDLNPSKEVADALKDCAKTMLQIKDGARLLMAAEAVQCDDSPMGLEFKYNVLQMMREMSVRDQRLGDKLPLAFMKGRLGKLQFPKQIPTVASEKFKKDHQKDFPPGFEPARIALELNTGKNVVDLAQELRGNKKLIALREPFFKATMGPNAKNSDNLSQMIADTGIDVKRNRKAIAQALNQGSPHGGNDHMLAVGLALMAISTGIQMLQQDEPQQQRAHAG